MTRAQPSTLTVVILAGGRASRMGGGDKPLRLLHGVPILSHVIARVARSGRKLVINANGDPFRFAGFGLPVIADAAQDYPGPLAGILAGLDWAALQGETGDILSVAGDCPFIPHDLAERLDQVRKASNQALACAGSGGWTHPVIGLWPINLREPMRAALDAGERKIDRFSARFGCATADWPSEPYDPFFNVNTPDELIEAERLLTLAANRFPT
ncbi:MobA Molybdopterin-guanine dinucleotide biosynthesis protein A [Rhabdaerophilaceae bacterium]